MPTLELHGYSPAAGEQLVTRMRALLADLPYRDAIVFDASRAGGRTIAWDGSEQPFVRVCSRSQERLDELRGRLIVLADVETLLIGFYPRELSSAPESPPR